MFSYLILIGYFFIFLYIIIPLFLYWFPSLFAKLIYLNFVYIPFFTHLNKPHPFKFNFNNWQNTKIYNKYGLCELGLWQILCAEDELSSSSNLQHNEFVKIFSNGRPIIIYFHGNSMHRGTAHRLKLYHILRESGYHVVTMDYRGFGDSSGFINNENHALEDALVTFEYVRSLAPNSPLFIWGHSLGTGISSLLLNKLSTENDTLSINGLILECPFTSVPDLMDHTPMALPWRCMPYFNIVFKQGLVHQKLTFNSLENLRNVNVPILILHAVDDKVLPYKLTQKLYSTLLSSGKVVFFKGYPAHLRYKHTRIINDPNLPKLIRGFTGDVKNHRINGERMTFDPNSI